jgi:hypothetical protein
MGVKYITLQQSYRFQQRHQQQLSMFQLLTYIALDLINDG